jgi:hypothetical protein
MPWIPNKANSTLKIIAKKENIIGTIIIATNDMPTIIKDIYVDIKILVPLNLPTLSSGFIKLPKNKK